MTPLKILIRNGFILNPCTILCIATTQHIGIPHRIAGMAALCSIPICIAIAALPACTNEINRHRIVAYIIATAAWLVGMANVCSFIYRIHVP